METVTFKYKFIFKDGSTRAYDIALEKNTGRVHSVPVSAPQSWTALEHHKCSHCPLQSSTHPDCPVAKNLAGVAYDFNAVRSYESVTIEVESSERTYRKTLPLQDGLFGLFGLLMATSDCPYFEFLRPMARYHLPFSTIEETMVRSVSFYLLRQHFLSKKGTAPDYDLKEFPKYYSHLNAVNRGIIDRIRSIAKADADANSLVILDAFASLLSSHLAIEFPDFGDLFSS